MTSFDPDDTTSFPPVPTAVQVSAVVDPTVSSARGPQDALRVLRAHLVRMLGQGGLRGPLAALTALATAVGVSAVPVLRHVLDDRPPLDVALRCADSAAFVVAAGWCLALVLDTAQAGRDGVCLTATTLVPRRRRLLLTHAGAAALLGAVATAIASFLTGAAAGAVLLGGAGQAWTGRLLVGTLMATVSTAMLAAMAVAIGSLVRHPALALLTLLVGWVAVPTAINSVGFLLPEGATTVTTTLAHLCPSTMGGRSVTGIDSPTALLANQAGLAAWTALMLWVADLMGSRRDLV
ncbi:hypothetical protein [Nocardioides yefusunii]|uniref:ABC transporter permease n=1 Tax=Nocardioides yefusunii TaxID=2500546 RepID=A0ABW1QUX3_9ACTN|nr:hypothetical protein [Nocardioides yefusunii]